MRRHERGFQLIEMLAVLAVCGIGATLVVPPLLRATARLRLELAAQEVAGTLQKARWTAIRHSANVAVRFRVAGSDVSFGLYRDGDGDGVLNRDIDAGVDPEVSPPRRLEHVGADVRFGLPARPVRDPGDPRAWLENPADPVRFNRSDLASFSPLGGSTPGSLYLTDGAEGVAAVRVSGRTGRVQVLRYDFATGTWR
jgi:prepilin-type N-terminal cleavage/methylation domain-containing protein